MPSQPSDQFESDVSSGKIRRLYLFDGPENWLKERAVQKIYSKLLPQEAADFNYEKFYGETAATGAILSSAMSLPFLADRRLVVVDGVDELTSAERNQLADGLTQIPDTTCLVLVSRVKVNARDPLGAEVLSHGRLITFWTPFANQMPAWIQRESRTRGKTLDLAAAQALAESCQDLQQVSNELEKLFLFVGKKSNLVLKDILEFGLPNDAGDQKLLEAALYERNLEDALRQAHLLALQGVRAEALLPTVDRVMRQLALAHYYYYDKRMSVEEISSELGIRGMTQKRLLERGIKVFESAEIEASFSKIAEADFQLKTGLLTSEISVSLLLLSLLKQSPVRV